MRVFLAAWSVISVRQDGILPMIIITHKRGEKSQLQLETPKIAVLPI